MAILSTGPIHNNPVSGVRPTQSVTVRIVNRSSVSTAGLLIEGYYLNTLRKFMITTNGIVETEIGISVWGKEADSQLAEARRVVAHEKLA